MKQSLLFAALVLGYNVHPQTWNLGGNANTNSNIDFLSTIDKASLVFRVNSIEQ